jgi:hypothetical protein
LSVPAGAFGSSAVTLPARRHPGQDRDAAKTS